MTPKVYYLVVKGRLLYSCAIKGLLSVSKGRFVYSCDPQGLLFDGEG